MTSPNEAVAATVKIFAATNLPEEQVDALTRRLLLEVRESGIPAELVAQPGTQTGAKGGEWLAIGEFLMRIMPTAVPIVSSIFKGWLDKDKDREVSVELPNGVKFNLKGSMPLDDIERLVGSLNAVSTATPANR